MPSSRYTTYTTSDLTLKEISSSDPVPFTVSRMHPTFLYHQKQNMQKNVMDSQNEFLSFISATDQTSRIFSDT